MLYCSRSFIPRISYISIKYFHHEFTQKEPVLENNKVEAVKRNSDKSENKIPENNTNNAVISAYSKKYKLFRDEDSPEIFDVEEEVGRYQTHKDNYESIQDKYVGVNLNRGIQGMFDVKELVDILRKEMALNIFVTSVPKELKYVDYMVLCSARNYRNMWSIANFVRYLYKIKCQNKDILPKIEGEKSRDWMAMDLGNIALHILSPAAREFYDLESLWAIGAEYDIPRSTSPDPLIKLFENYSNTHDSTSNHEEMTKLN